MQETERVLVVLATYLLSVFGAGFVVQWCCGRLLRRIDSAEIRDWVSSGIPGAGRIIGWLERFLVTTFILMGEPSATAVVLAAKGILRFAEISGRGGERQRVVAEYVILGTLLSFALAVGVAAGARWLLEQLT